MAERLPTKRFSHDFPFILRIEEMPFYKLALPELGSLVSRPNGIPKGISGGG